MLSRGFLSGISQQDWPLVGVSGVKPVPIQAAQPGPGAPRDNRPEGGGLWGSQWAPYFPEYSRWMSSGRVALGPTAFSAKQNTACRLSLKRCRDVGRGCSYRLAVLGRRRAGRGPAAPAADRRSDGAPGSTAPPHSPDRPGRGRRGPRRLTPGAGHQQAAAVPSRGRPSSFSPHILPISSSTQGPGARSKGLPIQAGPVGLLKVMPHRVLASPLVSLQPVRGQQRM